MTAILIVFFLGALTDSAFSAPKAASASGNISAKPKYAPSILEDAEVRRILGELEKASQKAMDAAPDLKARMTTDLKSATSIQNPQARRKALDSYRAKYRADYQQALKTAGVDVMNYAGQIAKSFGPRYNVKPVINDLGWSFIIVFTASAADLARALPPAPSDEVIPYASYSRYASNSCAGFTGSSVTDRDDGFHVSTSGGFAAGCGTRASREASTPTTSRATTTMQQQATVNLNGTVAGIVGLGVCSLWVDLTLHGGDTPTQRTYRATTLVAPILWVASWGLTETWTHSATSTRDGFLSANYFLDVGAAAGILGGADCHGDIGAIRTHKSVRPR
jgi:hypothetical protein